ncbi:uncharacterized protein EDB93DRAFT_1258349 [Suillus bovinus]|uniref:uncharacterized protein n=1 Tax=Suillus bovinus TaxID=48563 RepID=UPI001B85C5E8|nr:uncharacterized protein EDB93DRAFT_1258349 [Suillus bovinus]KAG2125181.1 hypothetical protein EDB93DRAFT_1258349 [Suillus bovinus]
MAPSHHPPPISQMYTPSTLNDYQGDHTVPLNLPIPCDSSRSMHTAQPTLSTFLPLSVPSGLGNYMSPSISSSLHAGASAPMWAPPPLPPTWSNSNSYQGNWPSTFPFHLHPSAMVQMRAPPPTHNDHNSSLPLPHVIVPSQHYHPGNLAILALSNFQHTFPPPIVSMDGVSSVPPAAPADVQPLTMLTPPPRSDIGEISLKCKVDWQFIKCLGQRQKGFRAPQTAPSATHSGPLPSHGGSVQPPLLVSKTHTQIDLASEEGTT